VPSKKNSVGKQPNATVKELSKAIEQFRDTEWAARRENLKRSIGRPTRYRREFAERVIDYFMRARPYRTINTMFGPKEIAADLPTLAGFAMEIGVHRETLNNWASETTKDGRLKHPEFFDAIKKAKTIQEDIWATNSLRKLYDRTFAIFFGKNNLDYVDRVHVAEEQAESYDDMESDQAVSSADDARKLARQ